MPKRLIEINKFTGGIVSTPSATDIDEQSAKYSLNIDAQTADGRLQGVNEDVALSSIYTVENVRRMISVSDKKNIDNINLVFGKTSNVSNNSVNIISIVQDALGSRPSTENVFETVSSANEEHTFIASDDKVFIGLGGTSSSVSKVLMRPSGDSIDGTSDDSIGLFDAALSPPNTSTYASMFSEFMVFPIHGRSSSLDTALARDDSNNTTIKADYDALLDDTTNAMDLYTALQSTSSSSTIKGFKIGQVFMQHDDGDFADGAMVGWKQYDYDASVTAVAIGDLFMFCGYIEGTENVPVLRYLGNAGTQGGTPAFAYAMKNDDSQLYKISLTDSTDTNAFDSNDVDAGKRPHDSNGDDHIIKNVGNRISSIDLKDMPEWPSGSISAISACHSPPLFNSIGLLGENDSSVHTAGSSTLYHDNGHIKILYRHGVFYVASESSSESMYRLNAIDFHNITALKTPVDNISLNFSRIPDQLHAEDGKGMVRRTIEDQLIDNPYDPKKESWSNRPSNAKIIGICETFECGKVTAVAQNASISAPYYAWKFTTLNRSRLTSGDKVRFAGMNTTGGTATVNKAFNVHTPYEVSIVDDGDSFYVNTASADRDPSLNSIDTAQYNMWWNNKVWILYGKKSTSESFNKWDLFLYNTNILDMEQNRQVYMADRTPPYHQARYYETSTSGNSDEKSKLWYPGEFAFVKKDYTPGFHVAEDSDNDAPGGLTISDVTAPKSDISGNAVEGQFCEFGIYDKSGRWACNGTQRVTEAEGSHTYNGIYIGHGVNCYHERPTDWVGGQYGPRAWNGCYHLDHQHTDVNSSTWPISPGEAGQGDDDNVRGISGHLIWGQNIGWSIDNQRKIYTTNNSLHPSVPYSTLYNGSLIYTGYNDTEKGEEFPTTISDVTPQSEVNDLGTYHANFNRPKHAVTFIGQVEGDFVVQPGLIGRSGISRLQGHNRDDDMDRAFEMDSADWDRVKRYNKDYSLFSIDDFTGHRGSVRDAHNNESISITNVENEENRPPKGGVSLARPNWGGPEIEPAIYRGTYQLSNGKQAGSHSSVNGGYSDADGDENDKGWDGYTPPYLFNPGSGYYVYINRTWKNMCDNTDELPSQGSFDSPTRVWGFQTLGLKSEPGFDNVDSGIRSQRWHNFSSTALSDNISTEFDLGDGVSLIPASADTLIDVRTRFYNADYVEGGYTGYTNGAKIFHKTHPIPVGEICTMHKIAIPNLGKINSIFPFIMQSVITRNASGATISSNNFGQNDFFAGYICGIDNAQITSSSSAALVLRTNFDFVHSIAHGKRRISAYTGKTWHHSPYTTHNDYPLVGGTPHRQEMHNSGTHNAEIFDITNTATNLTESMHRPDSLQRQQAQLHTYTSTVTGNNLVLMKLNPWEVFDIGASAADSNVNWFFQVNSLDNSNLYLAKNHDSFQRTAVSVIREDLALTFFSASNAAEDSGQLLSGADDTEIFTTLIGAISFTVSSEGTTGTLTEGTYYYKLAFEYDNIYESTLSSSSSNKTISPSTAGNTFEYIQINMSLPANTVAALEKRVTGIVIYRKYEAGEGDEYRRLKVLKTTDNWIIDSTNNTYEITVMDRGVLQGSYSANNGIDETLENTSLNYGLSTAFQGYLFVSKAWHSNLENVTRYIFRSQPNNFFSFDWTKDFIIIPETPIGMTSFNSRLYVWGKNSLYKIDPYSMLIEETYEGYSLLSSDSFVATEHGLFFADANNIYIHDGNQPMGIADPILFSSNDSVIYTSINSNQISDGYVKLEHGYRELAESSILNNYNIKMMYSGVKDSIVIFLSDSGNNGKAFAFNIKRKRWDLWESPQPHALTTTKDSKLLIADNKDVYKYLEAKTDEWSDYNRRDWDWFSKHINFGADTQDKVFRNIKMSGLPSIYNFAEGSVYPYGTTNAEGIEMLWHYASRFFNNGHIWTTDSHWEFIGNQALHNGTGQGYIAWNGVPELNVELAKTYKISFFLYGAPGETVRFTIFNGSGDSVYVPTTTYTEFGMQELIFTFAGSNTTGIRILADDSSNAFVIDNISVKPYESFDSVVQDSVQAFVDEEPIALSIKDKFHETLNLGNTYLYGDISAGITPPTSINIQGNINKLRSGEGISNPTDLEGTQKQKFIRPGHLIKIDNEIMLVEETTSLTTQSYTTLQVKRGMLNTTISTHTAGISNKVYVVSPILKFPAGTKGKNLSLRLRKQKGHIDSIGVVYKPKSIK